MRTGESHPSKVKGSLLTKVPQPSSTRAVPTRAVACQAAYREREESTPFKGQRSSFKIRGRGTWAARLATGPGQWCPAAGPGPLPVALKAGSTVTRDVGARSARARQRLARALPNVCAGSDPGHCHGAHCTRAGATRKLLPLSSVRPPPPVATRPNVCMKISGSMKRYSNGYEIKNV